MSRSSSNPFDSDSSNPFDDHPSQYRPAEANRNLLPENGGDRMRNSPKFEIVLQKFDKSLDQNGVNNSIVAVDLNDENAVVRFLMSNRVYGYPTSDGSIMSNYRHFVCNNHPLLSIVFARRCHPYNTKKRLIVFICIICFAIGLAYVFYNTNYVYQISVCREGCTHPPDSTDTSLANHCYGGFNNGLSFGSYGKNCDYYQSWMLSAACGAILVPYGSLLQFLVTCGCVQGRDFFKFNCCGSRVRGVLEYFGGIILFSSLVISIAIIAWALLATYVRNTGYAFFQVLLVSKVWAVADWFLWTLPYFSFRYPRDKRYFYRRLPAEPKGESISTNSI